MNDIIDMLNLDVMFVIRERTGYSNNKDIYEIKFESAYGNFPFYINQNFASKFYNDFVHSLNLCLSISKQDELNDVDKEVKSFQLGMDYLCSIIFCASGDVCAALKKLNNISNILKNKKIRKKNLLHIKKNLVYRYSDTYYVAIMHILHNEPYYKNKDILNKLKKYYTDYKEIINNNKRDIEKNYYRCLDNEKKFFGAIILYEEGKVQSALDLINTCDLTINPNANYLFDKAFLLAILGKYKMSYDVYCRISKKKHIDDWLVNEVIGFIEKRNELNESSLNIKFCLSIVNYFFKDKYLAKKYMEELSSKNEEMKKIFDNLKWEVNL